MNPAIIRQRLGVFLGSSAIASILVPTPVFAQTIDSSLMFGAAPTAIAAGAVGFGVISTFIALKARKQGALDNGASQAALAAMRAHMDTYEAVLASFPETNILWSDGASKPKIFGQPEEFCSDPARTDALLDFQGWLYGKNGGELLAAVRDLRANGRGFALNLTTRNGRDVRALGRAFGGGIALRLQLPQPAAGAKLTLNSHQHASTGNEQSDDKNGSLKAIQNSTHIGALEKSLADVEAALAILPMLKKPAWVRDTAGELIFANSAYISLAHKMACAPIDDAPYAEIFTSSELVRQQAARASAKNALSLDNPLPDFPEFEVILFPLEGGSAGYLGLKNDSVQSSQSARGRAHNANEAAQTGLGELTHISGVIDALNTPVIVFDAAGQLEHFNSAYRKFWEFDKSWLTKGLTEKAILDRLRTRSQLPSTPNYQVWRAEHLKSYDLTGPEQHTWHMPDGRTINFVAAPAGTQGGVIYVFEDVTERLKLETANNALVNVQRETLNALSEAVAVFSPDGRLRLYNPQVSNIWKLPTNLLDGQPHIDVMAETCSQSWPEDGATIWQDLKRSVLDLNPNRKDRTGRFNRSDARLIDYTVTRMPDGQTMLTFVDVTESANYERVLKERNDALVTADRLKDAFVQSVSYELRSPLTNIIGFADLLASDDFGPLNERQKQYAGYIRASSATLGVLIDNVLDLTHVDAGIAELDLQSTDIASLVDKAKAGLAATFLGVGDDKSINLNVELADDLPDIVVDGTRVVQILYNLLSSAARFSEPGSQINLRVLSQGEWVKFIVEDDGVGVPNELRDILERSDAQSAEGRQRGAALGLSIVNAFVHLHGGTISVNARQPRGTSVVVNMPVDAASIAAPSSLRSDAAHGR